MHFLFLAALIALAIYFPTVGGILFLLVVCTWVYRFIRSTFLKFPLGSFSADNHDQHEHHQPHRAHQAPAVETRRVHDDFQPVHHQALNDIVDDEQFLAAQRAAND